MQCDKKRTTRRAGSKWKLSNCWLYKTYICKWIHTYVYIYDICTCIYMYIYMYNVCMYIFKYAIWCISLSYSVDVIVFFFLIVLPWFGHVFSNKGRFGHRRKLPFFLLPHLTIQGGCLRDLDLEMLRSYNAPPESKSKLFPDIQFSGKKSNVSPTPAAIVPTQQATQPREK